MIDLHIIHNKQEESDSSFSSRLADSLHELARYISENRNSLFKNVTTVRGITYDTMAKVAERLGFKKEEIDRKSIGSPIFKIAGEYRHTQMAKRGKQIENFYAIYMPIEDFLANWVLKNNSDTVSQ